MGGEREREGVKGEEGEGNRRGEGEGRGGRRNWKVVGGESGREENAEKESRM